MTTIPIFNENHSHAETTAPTLAALTLVPLALAGCSSDAERAAPHDDRRGATVTTGPTTDATEQPGPRPRLAVTYDGGVLVLDAATGETLLDDPSTASAG